MNLGNPNGSFAAGQSHDTKTPGEQETHWDKTNKENCHFTANAYYMYFRITFSTQLFYDTILEEWKILIVTM